MDVAYSLAGADLEVIDRRRCVAEIDVGGSHIVTHAAISLDDARYVLSSGDLLPFPDPTDVASWSCLVQDLVRAHMKAHGWAIPKEQAVFSADFADTPTPWALCCMRPRDGRLECYPLSFPAGVHPGGDIALALVLARIHLRETETKKGTST